jgi:hypothetical protein
MSGEFENRLDAILAAYLRKVEARQAFVAHWSRLSAEVVKPKLRTAKRRLSHRVLFVSDDDGKDHEIIFTLRPIPIPNSSAKTLSYRPNQNAEVVLVTKDLGKGKSESKNFSLADISEELIESQVEEFLKDALNLSDSSD